MRRTPPRPAHTTHLARILIALLVLAGPAHALDGQLGLHDPSTIVRCDETYYVFSTGPNLPFHTSSNGVTWLRGGQVMDGIPASVKTYVPKNNGTEVWAPEIIHRNGLFYLYYSVSRWGEPCSAIGLLTNPTLDPKAPAHRWTDRGMVVHSVVGSPAGLNAIDPGICQAPDGRLWMVYGSYHGPVRVVELDPQTGLRIRPDSPEWDVASRAEAANIIHRAGYFYLFINRGSCCQGIKSTYHMLVGRAREVTGPYLDRAGRDLAADGGSPFLASAGTRVGPGHFGWWVENGVEQFSIHYEGDREQDGRPFLSIQPLHWTADGWPVAGPP